MPIVEIPSYAGSAFLVGGDAQTIFPSLFQKGAAFSYQRDELALPDCDFIHLDSLNTGSSEVVLLLHGLESSADSWYIRGMAKALFSNGFDVVALNFRGCSGQLNRLPKTYHSGATEDVGFVLEYLRNTRGYNKIHAIGYSLGGNVLLKYLGEEGESALVDVAVAFSVPCDLAGSSQQLAKGRNRFYMERFMIFLREKIRAKAKQYPDIFSTEGIEKIRNFYEFDDRYTAPIHGFDGVDDYYRRSSSLSFLHRIRKPTLLVSAGNDPFLSSSCYPFDEAARSDHFWLEVPKKGGHNGFPGKTQQGNYWTEERAISFILEKSNN